MGRSESSADAHQKTRWQAILVIAFVAELGNLFAITVTQGIVELPPLALRPTASFTLHALIAFALLLAHELVTRSTSRDKSFRLARVAIVLLCLVGTRLYFEHGVRLSADSPHYFAQAHTVLFDGDLDFDNDYRGIRPRIQIAERYPVGLALLGLPFLVAAHVLVLVTRWLGSDFTADGFGYPYETAFELSSILFASLALVYLLRVMTRLFPVGLSALALASAVSSSFLAWYMVIEPGMPHAMAFAWSTFFLGYWLEHRPVSRDRDWIVLGALAGVAAMVRWQNGVFVLLPIVDALLDGKRSIRPLAIVGSVSGLVFFPQFLFWYLTTGSPFTMPTSGHEVSWSQLRLSEVLYSTNRGLFPWNPVLYLGAAGLLIWIWHRRRLAMLFLLGFLMQVYVNGSVGIWWAGWSFGGRRFDGCFLFFVIGLAVVFDFVKRRPVVPLVAAVSLLAVWNFALVKQARLGLVPPDRLVSFREVSREGVSELYEIWGYPFAAPMNWLFASRYDTSPEKFDRLYGHVGFGNFRSSFDVEIEPYLTTGWGAAEPGFRWSVGRESTLLIPLREPRAYELRVDVRPFAGATPNRIGVIVNGSPQATRQVSELETVRFVLSEEMWRRGINTVSFYYGRTASPSSIGLGEDTRELGFAFRRVELVAIASDD